MSQPNTVTRLPVRNEPPITSLHFVHDEDPEAKTGSKKRSFWHVHSTGNYTFDFILGRELGREALAYMAAEGGSFNVLGWVVGDMMKLDREMGGIEFGFLQAIGNAAISGVLARPPQIAEH